MTPKNRSGALALFTVSALMLVLGVVAYAFHSMGVDVRKEVNLAHVGEQSLTLAQSAIDEAFDDLQRKVNQPPTQGNAEDRELSKKIRTAKTTDVIDRVFEPKLTRKAADLSYEVAPVDITIQRFREGAEQAQTMDARNLPQATKDKIKKGWEEFYKTGVCGPDMDLIYSAGSASGFVAARAKVTANGATAGVSRTLTVRRVFSHMTHSVTHADDLLRQLGVYPPTAAGAGALGIAPTIPVSTPSPDPSPSIAASPAPATTPAASGSAAPDPAPAPSPAASPASGDVSMDDIHFAPYDEVRLVDRSEEKGW